MECPSWGTSFFLGHLHLLPWILDYLELQLLQQFLVMASMSYQTDPHQQIYYFVIELRMQTLHRLLTIQVEQFLNLDVELFEFSV
jgi:hypothetical protein